jgi:predicted O-linked N-acetylglucosamine transferase (SPINDLY family)
VDNSRLEVLAYRPARVQGHFLGYPGTTGAPFVDFFIADRITIPPGAEAHFTERILRMPHCYQPNDPARVVPPAPPRSACGLREDALVICSLNQPLKINAATFARWCHLLQALPTACLWLLGFDARSQRNLLGHAKGNGIDPARLIFAGRVPQADHLARLRHADIAVDTFPCTSHTTASDLLWAGVPLITTRGDTFASRVAASVLTAAECTDWVFDDTGEAHAATLALASDPGALLEAKSRIEKARVSSPLFDAPGFARDFETLLESALSLGAK